MKKSLQFFENYNNYNNNKSYGNSGPLGITTRIPGTLSVPLFTASLKAKAMATRPS